MKTRLTRRATASLSLALALSTVISAQQPAQPNRRGDARPNGAAAPPRGAARERVRPSASATAALEEDFTEALTIVEENYVDGQKIDYGAAFKSSIIGMLRTLDPHSNFYDAKEFEELQSNWRSEYSGIGASIIDRTVKGEAGTYIIATFEGAPAARAGLRFGDRILEVDGQSVVGKNSAEVRDRLRGPKGTAVKVTVEKAATLARETVEITRATVPQPTVQDAYFIKPGIGYIDIREFNRTTAEEFAASLEDLRKQGMTQLVLDLRNNPGGLLDQAVKVASHFLPRGQVVLSQVGRTQESGGDRVYRSDNSQPDMIPLVVLVNRNSASASEIVAGALQDHDRALVIGETTFGKGLVQSIIPMEYGTALTLTSTKYLTPSGRLIQRDYTHESLYDYYTRGGIGSQDDEKNAAKPAPTPVGPESLTDTGRKVYGGGGIAPDEAAKPRVISTGQARLVDPIFAFVRELVNGRVRGHEDMKIARGIEFNRNLKSDEYVVTDNLFKSFKAFTLADASNKLTDAQLDKAREFIARQMRYDISMASYGTVTATQALNGDDPQVLKAIDVLPRARELAAAAQKGRNPNSKSFEE